MDDSCQRTDAAGSLALTIPLGRPDAEFDVVVVVQPKPTASGSADPTCGDPWAGSNAIHQRLAATRREFSDSVELVREDRDR
ncbi:MAG: hypothetical protein ACRC1K_07505 [Planctomycetia bacterium]